MLINTQNKSVHNNTDHEVPTKAQRTIDIATTIVRIYTRFTTPAILGIRPSNCASNLNVAQAHRNIFMALKLIEPTVKCFTPGNTTIYSLDYFPSEDFRYTSMVNDVIQYPKESRVYISFKIEPSRLISDLKYGSNSYMKNIFDTLKKITPFFVTKNPNPTKIMH